MNKEKAAFLSLSAFTFGSILATNHGILTLIVGICASCMLFKGLIIKDDNNE